MPNIIVCTNFSNTSRNALSYACSLISSHDNIEAFSILLLNVFTIPANYSGDGIALVTINNSLDSAEAELHEELEWVKEEYADVNVIGKVTTGRLLTALRDETDEMKATLVIIGAGGHYGELWSWDNNILSILRDLPIPVLTIPPTVTFKPYQDIAFACNLKNGIAHSLFDTIKNIIDFSKAKLHIIYVTTQEIKPGSKEAQNETSVRETLKEFEPQYHILLESQVVEAIGRFAEDEKIQLLLVIPTRHGIWESLFYKSYTKELSRLNSLPIIALH